MNRILQAWIWLRRIGHCRGFGIQSPTDYRFVRYVVNEHWPYYAYETMGTADDWRKRKLGKFYFRLANHLQPSTVIDLTGTEEYISEACPKAKILTRTDELKNDFKIELAIVPIQTEYQQLFSLCDDKSVVVFENIYEQQALWHCIEYSKMTAVTFDLYYCGVVFFDKTRSKQNYLVNF